MRYLLFGLLLMISFAVSSQDMWSTLGMVTFDRTFDAEFGMDMMTPNYNPVVLALNGKEVEVEGYFIALNGKNEQNHFMLSKFPQSTCFFCGKAGPETAMQVFLADGKKQKYSDEKIKVKGILRINTTDPTGLLYTLEQAKSIDP
jgi:hypothetical protein